MPATNARHFLAGLALAALGLPAAADNHGCSVDLEVGDGLSFSATALSAPSSCETFTVNLTHTGSLPAAAMGHNWVLVPTGTEAEIGTAATAAGAANNWVPDDDRIIAATTLIGGGESTSVTFSMEGLSGSYAYVCTFPGHWAAMKGTFTVE